MCAFVEKGLENAWFIGENAFISLLGLENA